MIELKLDKSTPSYWDPRGSIVSFRDSPIELAHELAHVRFGHGFAGSTIGNLYEERDAWREALRRLPPEEIKVYKVSYMLGTYLEAVGGEYGFKSRQYQMASKLVDEVVAYARKRKKEAR